MNRLLQPIVWSSIAGLLSGSTLFLVFMLLDNAQVRPLIYTKLGLELDSYAQDDLEILGERNGSSEVTSFVMKVLWSACIAFLFLQAYTGLFFYQTENKLDILRTLKPEYPFLLTFLVISAPRPFNAPLLNITLQSYVDVRPLSADDPFYSRTRYMVYSPMQDHPHFDQVQQHYEKQTWGANSIKTGELTFVKKTFKVRNQHLHFADALEWAAQDQQSAYVMIVEDDFPLCHGKWPEVQRIMAETWLPANTVSHQLDSNEVCGVFVATGGRYVIV